MKLSLLSIVLVAFIADGLGAPASWLDLPARILQSNTSASSNTDSRHGNRTSYGKDSSGSFTAPVAAPTSPPPKAPSGSFSAPVASPTAANAPEPVTHHTIVSDDNDDNSTSSGALAHHVYDDSANSTTILLPEGDQPPYWPHVLVVLFTAAALVLCAMTARKVWNKRRQYEEVPTTLIV